MVDRLSCLTVYYTGEILFGIIKQLFRTTRLLFKGYLELTIDRISIRLNVFFAPERIHFENLIFYS